MNRKSVFLLPAAMLAAAAAITAGCSSGGGKSGQTEAIPVKTLTLQPVEELSGRNYVGTVKASKTAVLSCSYSGTLKELRADVGDIVRKGDTIAVIESQNVISAKQMADAVLTQAEDGYRRLSQVYESGSVADVKMVEVRTQLDRARASSICFLVVFLRILFKMRSSALSIPYRIHLQPVSDMLFAMASVMQSTRILTDQCTFRLRIRSQNSST